MAVGNFRESSFIRFHYRRHAHGYGRGWDIREDHGICANAGVVADSDRPEQAGARADVHSPAEDRRASQILEATDAERAVLADDTIVANYAGAMDHNAGLMFDHDAATEPDRVGQLYPVAVADATEEKTIKEAERGAEDACANCHPPSAEAMNGNSAESGARPVATVGNIVLSQDLPKGQTLGSLDS